MDLFFFQSKTTFTISFSQACVVLLRFRVTNTPPLSSLVGLIIYVYL